ncbi:hypothetical protein SAM23877_p047 (plasmid) [Streptomyces ambofaciens ATCC 23877]|uniref:Uncharacterized protein n=1 Tax=Streptomyces ambofaciens (strain ATCC 23877 / 3486 / DSM 40053 / JCM 4204 / NBRC 12836 / NRRL B-2516) TaxID=278992 RepID=A0A0K2B6F3_STRA7|nr:hypothetical protein [Streptomyces ambofaciens]AKZ60756.1 hypothetical protein SAM23877_p047 [Streptomyces ambofaciens ATCC 23877]
MTDIAASEMVRAARLLEATGRDDDAVNLLDNVADGIRTPAAGEPSALPSPAETAPADESPHAYMDAVQDSAAWAYALTKAGQTAEALEHVEAMERLLAVYRRAVGA